jgi:hypothetical protein
MGAKGVLYWNYADLPGPQRVTVRLFPAYSVTIQEVADMLGILLLVIGCYASAALLVHVIFRFSRGGGRAASHYIFIGDQRQRNMEWHLRTLHSFSRWMGKSIALTIIDRGLNEESRAIVERWSYSGKEVTLHNMGPSWSPGDAAEAEGNGEASQMMWQLKEQGIIRESEQAVLIDLQNPADLSKMPF